MEEKWKSIGAIVLVIVGVILLGGTLRKGCAKSERLILANADLDIAVVEKMAREVKANEGPGKVVLVRYTGFIPGTIELQEALAKACRNTLGGDYEVAELPPPNLDIPEHGNWALRTGSGAWGKELKDWMAPHADAVAIISAVGVPHLPESEWQKLPPFYGSIPFPDEYTDAAIKAGMIKGLAIMRDDADPVAIRKFRGSSEDLFDMAYQWQTASDL